MNVGMITTFLTIIVFQVSGVHDGYLSTKTPYRTVAGNLNVEELLPSTYQLVYARYVGRHGSRLPGVKDIRRIKEIFQELSIELPNIQSVINISSIPLEEIHARDLAHTGIQELFGLGQRYRNVLQRLSGSTALRAPNFKFESTCRTRSIHSMIAFSSGFFPINQNTSELPFFETRPCNGDILYRFFDYCDRYTSYHKCSKVYNKEQKRFLESSVMKSIILDINQRLGLEPPYYISPYSALGLFLACAYNVSLNVASFNDGSCSVFSQDALNAYDYYLDIKNFFKKGNAFKVNLDVACPLLSNIYNSIIYALKHCPRHCHKDGSINCESTVRGNFGFAHAETIIPLMGAFGFLGSYPANSSNLSLTSDNYEYFKKNGRPFYGGDTSPMAGHIMFLAACPTDGISEGIIIAIHNEKPIQIPCCNGIATKAAKLPGACTLSEFIACFGNQASQCDFPTMCSQEVKCNNTNS